MIPIFQQTLINHEEYLQNDEKNVTAGEMILKLYENLMNSFSQIIHDIRMQRNASIQFLAFILLIEVNFLLLNMKFFLCNENRLELYFFFRLWY